MSKLSTLAPRAPKSKIRSKSKTPDTVTYEGGAGYSRKPKSELFLLAVANMVGESTFYENKGDRDSRFVSLIHKITKSDPEWIARFVPYLRNEMNMRSASLVMAVEYVIAGGPEGRKVIDSAIQRADEPGEVLGYYRSRVGRSVPQPIKRGVSDAVQRLYSERSFLRYGNKGGYSLGDVIRIAHPKPAASWQSELFKFILSDGSEVPERLRTLKAHKALMALPVEERKRLVETHPDIPYLLREAGMSWESLSGWLQGPMDAKAWEAIIPSMGYMALLRNLRNFEEARISDEMKEKVIARLTDPEEVKKSHQFPIRFYSAFKSVHSLDYKPALEKALQLTLQNVPSLPGKTLILVDNSGSMHYHASAKSTVKPIEIAGLFGAALALRAENAELVPYASEAFPKVEFSEWDPILEVAKKATRHTGGTRTMQVLQRRYDGHDRVVILTDEQAFYSAQVENIKPIYTFNLVGYKAGHLGGDGHYTFGGLTDAGFKVIELLESGKDDEWPF